MRIFFTIILILLYVTLSQAQSSTCANGDQLVINTTTKTYQCITPGAQPAGTGTTMVVANDTVTGTTLNKFAKLTGAPSKAVVSSNGDTENAIGVVTSGAGTTGNATITILGQVSCIFDGATTAGNYVTIAATGGGCHDAGSSYPTSGATYGRVLSTNGGAGTYVMELMTPDIAFQNAGNGKSKPGTPANSYQFNSSNQFAGGNLFRIDANTNQQSNTTNAQTLNLYKTTDSDASPVNFERLQIGAGIGGGSNPYTITSQAGGTGIVRDITISSGTAILNLNSGGTTQFGGAVTQVIPGADNTTSLGGVARAWSNVSATNLTASQTGSMIFSSGVRLKNGSNDYTLRVVDSGGSNAGTLALTPRNFTANSGSTNNPDFGTGAFFYRITPNAAGSTLTGGRDVTIDGEIHQITNVGSALLTLANQNTGSTAGNRWLSNTGMDVNLAADESAVYYNDATTTRQRLAKFETSDTAVVTTQFDKTNATLADVTTDRTFNVSTSRTYQITVKAYYDADVTGGSKWAIGGTATATAIIYQINTICNASNLNVITSRQTALAGSAGQAGCTAGFTEIHGTVTVNAAGTLTLQFAQNTASGTSSVLVGSTVTLTKIR